jgi:hypothetical protein
VVDRRQPQPIPAGVDESMGRSSGRKYDVSSPGLNPRSVYEKRSRPAMHDKDLLVGMAVESRAVPGWRIHQDPRQVSSVVGADEVACLVAAR